MKLGISKIIFIVLPIFLVGFFVLTTRALATYQTIELGGTIVLGEFVYEDDYTASTADCTITIYDTTNTIRVNAGAMTENANGWHYYSYSVGGGETAGIWPAYITCGSLIGGDLVKVDKTFSVTSTSLYTDLTTVKTNVATLITEVGTGNVSAIKAKTDTISWANITALPASVWDYSARTLSSFGTLVADVWDYSTRTLSSFGTLVADVWDSLTSSHTTVGSVGKLLSDNINATISSRASLSNQTADWTIVMSDYSSVETGNLYRAKVEIRNSQSVPTAPFATPTVTVYDPDRNAVVSGISMTSIGTGLYEYTYTLSGSATQGVWETVVSSEVESGKTLKNNDYWVVAGSPAQVIINSVTATSVPNASANLTITNEGLAGYEYDYEWCVVEGVSDECGGGDDIYRGTGAKFINPGEDWKIFAEIDKKTRSEMATKGGDIIKVGGDAETPTIDESTSE